LAHETLHDRKKDWNNMGLESRKWECSKCGAMHKMHAELRRCLSNHYRVNMRRKTKTGEWK
jgi:hypothetical protein